ncbi:MAG: hypothetical protein Q9173_006798 [Seirophora scorigena]
MTSFVGETIRETSAPSMKVTSSFSQLRSVLISKSTPKKRSWGRGLIICRREHDLSAGKLVQARTHFHHLGIQSIAESFSDRSSTLCEVARHVTDDYTTAISSIHKSCSLPAHSGDPNLTQVSGKKDNDAPSPTPTNTFEPLSSTDGFLLLSPQNDALAADAQLQRELLQAIPHEE